MPAGWPRQWLAQCFALQPMSALLLGQLPKGHFDLAMKTGGPQSKTPTLRPAFSNS